MPKEYESDGRQLRSSLYCLPLELSHGSLELPDNTSDMGELRFSAMGEPRFSGRKSLMPEIMSSALRSLSQESI